MVASQTTRSRTSPQAFATSSSATFTSSPPSLRSEGWRRACNAVFLLDDFTEGHRALRALPGSHRSGRLPSAALADLAAATEGEVLVTGRAGDVVVMNAHLWHAGTANRTPRRRLALHAFCCRRDKQQQDQRRWLRPETVARRSPEARAVLALDDHPPPGQCRGRGPSGFPR